MSLSIFLCTYFSSIHDSPYFLTHLTDLFASHEDQNQLFLARIVNQQRNLKTLTAHVNELVLCADSSCPLNKYNKESIGLNVFLNHSQLNAHKNL